VACRARLCSHFAKLETQYLKKCPYPWRGRLGRNRLGDRFLLGFFGADDSRDKNRTSQRIEQVVFRNAPADP
jgi:hypothetical protein